MEFAGWYDIVLAGSGGGTYGSFNSSGAVLKTRIWLEPDDTITYSTHARPVDYTIDGTLLNVNGGKSSTLTINGIVKGQASGGSATAKESGYDGTGLAAVHLYTTDNISYVEHLIHTCSGDDRHQGDCYTQGICGRRISLDSDPTGDGEYSTEEGDYHCKGHWHGDDWQGSHYYSDRDEWWDIGYCIRSSCCPTRYLKNCGYESGQLQTTGSPALANSIGMTVTDLTNTDSGYFSIQLAEVSNLYMNSIAVSETWYNNYKYNVVVKDGVCVYCKHNH